MDVKASLEKSEMPASMVPKVCRVLKVFKEKMDSPDHKDHLGQEGHQDLLEVCSMLVHSEIITHKCLKCKRKDQPIMVIITTITTNQNTVTTLNNADVKEPWTLWTIWRFVSRLKESLTEANSSLVKHAVISKCASLKVKPVSKINEIVCLFVPIGYVNFTFPEFL